MVDPLRKAIIGEKLDINFERSLTPKMLLEKFRKNVVVKCVNATASDAFKTPQG